MIKWALYAVFGIAVAAIGYHLYGENSVRQEVRNNFGKLASEIEALNKDNEKIKEDIDYYSDPHNLEKELRANSNYRAPNEKLIIVAPGN